jgi:lipoprotein-anchoring transpeptidase ErfK/SrfK
MRHVTRVIVVSLLLAAVMDGEAAPVAAQGWGNSPFSWFNDAPRPRAPRYVPRRDRPVPARPRAETNLIAAGAVGQPRQSSMPVTPTGALVAIISIRDQSLTVWDATGPLLQSRVSTGQSGYATPTGLFNVIQKNRYHESNIYSGAPMPFMQRITWSGIALHGGIVPNYPASHGCIRLPHDFAPKLWEVGRIGMRVIVAPSATQPQAIASDLLPQPRMVSTVELDEAVRRIRGAPAPALQAQTGALSDGMADRRFNPHEVAVRLRKEAAGVVDARKRAAQEALAVAALASAEANAAVAALRAAKVELDAAIAEAESRARTADNASSVDQAAAKIAADNRLADARLRFAAARVTEADREPRAFAAARAAREAEAAADEAPDVAKQAARGVEPVSIFISRKEGMILVRQGFEPLLDAAIEIRDGLAPLGTHVFTAMAPDAGGTGVVWSAVTMPMTQSEMGGSAADALARVKLPEHVREQIARRLWVGASLIISDEGISRETGKGTDFVVLTK